MQFLLSMDEHRKFFNETDFRHNHQIWCQENWWNHNILSSIRNKEFAHSLKFKIHTMYTCMFLVPFHVLLNGCLDELWQMILPRGFFLVCNCRLSFSFRTFPESNDVHRKSSHQHLPPRRLVPLYHFPSFRPCPAPSWKFTPMQIAEIDPHFRNDIRYNFYPYLRPES